MENDAPVVGQDAPTANSKMVKPDIATADWNRPTSGLRVMSNQTPTASPTRPIDQQSGFLEFCDLADSRRFPLAVGTLKTGSGN
jgi:hypothetical protein